MRTIKTTSTLAILFYGACLAACGGSDSDFGSLMNGDTLDASGAGHDATSDTGIGSNPEAQSTGSGGGGSGDGAIANGGGAGTGVADANAGAAGSASDGSASDGATGSDGAIADGGAADANTADASDAGLDGTACTLPTNTLYVNSASGNNQTGNGSQPCPLRTITKALSLASTAAAITTIHIVGGTPGTPLIYSAGANGESFPLSPRAGLSLQGDGLTTVTISGTGLAAACPGNSACTMAVTTANVALSGFTLQAIGGTRGITASAATGLSLTDMTISNCPGAGVVFLGASGGTLTRVATQGNGGFGINVQGSSQITLDNVTSSQNGGGLVITDTAQVTSSSCYFNANNGNDAQGAVVLSGTAHWTSTDDQVMQNARDGVLLGNPNNPTANVNVVSMATGSGRGCRVEGNGTAAVGHGIRVFGNGSTVKLSGCSVLANTGNGVFMNGTANTADLGIAANSGNNVLQSNITARANSLAGVCNSTALTINARGNHWGACPVSTTVACAARVDVGTPGGGAVDSTGCVTP